MWLNSWTDSCWQYSMKMPFSSKWIQKTWASSFPSLIFAASEISKQLFPTILPIFSMETVKSESWQEKIKFSATSESTTATMKEMDKLLTSYLEKVKKDKCKWRLTKFFSCTSNDSPIYLSFNKLHFFYLMIYYHFFFLVA